MSAVDTGVVPGEDKSGLTGEGSMLSRRMLVVFAVIPFVGCSFTSSPIADTAPPPCPIDGGDYLLTQGAGGTYTVSTLPPFALPSGGTIVEEVHHANSPDCVHEVVVPAGGFKMPVFCVPGLSFSVAMTQTECGAGYLDSNGGSDFNVAETGDSTDSSGTCPSVPSVCTQGADSAQRVEVIVGDDAPDVCTGSGTANELLSIPIQTVIWLHTPASPCPDPDGMPGGSGDAVIAQLSQTLDLTTDQSFSEWRDFDKDGCCLNGAGPSATFNPCTTLTGAPVGSKGSCLDPSSGSVTLAATGTAASALPPFFDLTYSLSLPYVVSGPTSGGIATCPAAPAINFAAPATRCIP